MQLTKTLTIESGTVTVKELKVSIARAIIANFKRFEGVDIRALLLDRFDEASAFLTPLLEFSGDGSIDNLSFSELVAVRDAFLEVNAAFLELMGLGDLVQALFGPEKTETQLPNSTAVASPSSSEDMSA